MPKTRHEELQEWYKNFSKELYEKAHIDVSRPEDLGRIKNYYILNWDDGQPTGPEVDFNYAFMKCNGHEYVNPAPNFSDFQAYSQWMRENLDPVMDDDRIEQLMEMSKAGTLMVFNPGASDGGMRQVHTDEFGKINISLPIGDYMEIPEEQIPEDMRLPEIPQPVEVPNPAEYGLTGMPEVPVAPNNMNPGFWSWVGYKLGMDTDYAKLVRYQDAAATYDDRFRKWYDGLDDMAPGVSEYKMDKSAREQYLQEFESFRSNPLGLLRAIDDGYRGYMISKEMANPEFANVEMKNNEMKFLAEQHAKLPQGMIDAALGDVNKLLQGTNRTDVVIKNLMGNEKPNYEKISEWVIGGIIDPGAYDPKGYELPKHPDHENLSKAEQEAHAAHMKSLASIVNYAALADPKVSGNPPRPGLTQEEVSKQNYTMILQNVFTSGRNNTRHLMPNLLEAREVGKAALEAYNNGDVKPVAELLANALRQTNREAACLSELNKEHALNTLHIVSKLYKTLEGNKELMEAAGLTKEELEETKANMELHKVITKGLEAKKAIMEHALYKRDMTPEELRQAGRDVLFANTVAGAVKDHYNQWTKENELKPEHIALEEEMGRTANAGVMEQEAMAAVQNKAANAQQLTEAAQKMRNAHQTAISKMALEDFQRPVSPVSLQLLDQNWVKQSLQQLEEKCMLDNMLGMNRTELGNAFRNDARIAQNFGPTSDPLAKAGAVEKDLSLNNEKVGEKEPIEKEDPIKNGPNMFG